MEKALALSYHFLSFRPRSVYEIQMFLRKKAKRYLFSENEIQSAIEILKDQGFLNDLEFIKSFVSSRNILKPKGKNMLQMELKKFGIHPEDIEAFFSENTPDEDNLAIQALQKKIKALASTSDEKKRFIKAISFLQRRGFSYEIAKKAYLHVMGR